MKVFLLLSFICVFTISGIAQNEKIITVLDANTKLPIPYVTITYNGNKGLYTDEEGRFLSSKNMSNIKLSCIGYYSKNFILKNSTKNIFLIPKSYKIEEVTIKSKKEKHFVLGYYKGKERLAYHYYSGDELAVLIKNNTGKSLELKKIIIAVDLLDYFNTYDFISIFKVNVYRITDNDKIGTIVNTRPLLYDSKILKKKTILIVDNQSIIIPPQGAFVAIEWVGKINKNTRKIEKDKTQTIEPNLWFTDRPEPVTVYKRNKLSDNNWKLIKANKYLTKGGYSEYIPRISIMAAY